MDAYIVDHVRTPRGRGRIDGALHAVTPMRLATQVLEAIRDRTGLDTSLVEDVVFGVVSPVAEQGSVLPRIAALMAGYGEGVPGKQLNRFCASGLEAVNEGAAQIMAGQSDVVLAGGVESMSRIPMGSDGGAWSTDPAVSWMTYFVPQGISADLLATMDGFTRADVDRYAEMSQSRACAAWANGWFGRSVVPVRDLSGRVVLDRDEHPRAGTTVEQLSTLKPAFARVATEGGFDAVALQRYPEIEFIDHVHTAGNSSGIVDGSCSVLLASRTGAAAIGVAPRARIRAFASVGSEPTLMLDGPAPAARKALGRAGMRPSDIDLWEINEAFAAVVLHFMREMDLTIERVNVAGGAIAMGHPLGATGAIILGTVLDELERRDLNTALVTLCVGAGMGTATIIERV